MAIELHIFLEDARVPSCHDLQKTLIELGFATVLDASFNLRQDNGFITATYKKKETGFEFDLGSSERLLRRYDHIADVVGDRDMVATFRWSNDVLEAASATATGAALTQLADGVYFYPDDDLVYTAEDVVETIREELQ